MRKVLPALALLILSVAAVTSHAATQVTVIGFQYAPSGWVTADPFNVSAGSATGELPGGTPASAPVVPRGDSIAFTNMDPVPHTVTKVSGPSAGTWAALNLSSGANATLSISSTFPRGSYVYRCTIHQGMRGAFTVE